MEAADEYAAHLVLEHKVLAVAAAWILAAYWRALLALSAAGLVAIFILGLTEAIAG